MTLESNKIIEKLHSIQKLGEYFRGYYPDWKITLMNPQWQQQGNDLIRKIAHEGGGQILALAEVEVPQATFAHFQVELKNLGERSIGDHFLFIKKNVERSPFTIFQTEFTQDPQWARRSQFLVEGFPLTITEYFTAAGIQCLLD